MQVLLKENARFTFTMLLSLRSFTDLRTLAAVLFDLRFDASIIRQIVFICAELEEKHRAVHFSKLNGHMLLLQEKECNNLQDNVLSFVERMFLKYL